MRIIPSRKANLKKKKRTNKNYIVKKSPLEEEKMRIISLRKAHLTNREIRIILGKHQYENYAVKKSPFEEEEMRIIPSRKAHLANKNMKIMEEKPTSQRRNKKITLWRIIDHFFLQFFWENIMKHFGRIAFVKFTNGKFGGHLFSSKFMLNLLAVKVS